MFARSPSPVARGLAYPPMAAFDLDEGNWVATPEFTEKLSWRGDPATTFSDWCIVIDAEEPAGLISASEAAVLEDHTFHVHRAILSQGPRASGYFHTLLSTQMSETTNRQSTIQLPLSCAKVFGSMLDFIYGEQLRASCSDAVPLMELARRFQLPAMGKELGARLNAMLRSPKDAPVLLAHAIDLKLDKVLTAALKVMAQNFGQLSSDPIIERLPVPVLVRLLSDDELGVWSEDDVCQAVEARLMAEGRMLPDGVGDSAQALWPCVRFACLSSEKQLGILSYRSVPRQLFFVDALRAAQMHRGDGEFDTAISCDEGSASRLTYKMRGYAWANPKRFNVCTSAEELGSRGYHDEIQHVQMPGGIAPPASLLPTSGFATDVCIVVTQSGSNRAKWIRFDFHDTCLIHQVSIAGVHPTGKDNSMRNWNPKSGAGASIVVHDGSREITVGVVPADFGERQQLVQCTFKQMPAKWVRIAHSNQHSNTGSGLAFSQVAFS